MAGPPPNQQPGALDRLAILESRLYRSELFGEYFLKKYMIGAPVLGLWDAMDPAAAEYPPNAAPVLENIRLSRGTWLARAGSVLDHTLPTPAGGGVKTKYLNNFYSNASPAVAYHVAVRGGIFYYATGGGGYAAATGAHASDINVDNRCHGLDLDNYHYFLDGGDNTAVTGRLRRFDQANLLGLQVIWVQQPTAPALAPTVKKAIWGVLDGFTGSAPFGWTDPNPMVDPTIGTVAAAGPADPGFPEPLVNGFDQSGSGAFGTAKLTPTAKKQFMAKNTANQALNSHTIACWFEATHNLQDLAFEIGVSQAGEFSFPFQAPAKSQNYQFFADVGYIPKISYKRFIAIRKGNGVTYIGALYLPGNLEGIYYWRYTFYDPATGIESAPSPASTLLDLSAIGVSNTQGSEDAFYKCAFLTPGSTNVGGSPSTKQIRFYRNGGDAPGLTLSPAGQQVWYLIGTVGDCSGTLAANSSIGATTLQMATGHGAPNLGTDDWIVVDTGSGQEFLQVTSVANIGGNDLIALKTPAVFAHTAGVALTSAWQDNKDNSLIDFTQGIDLERDDCPTGARYITKTPDGRLVVANWGSHPMGVAFSNKPTPYKPFDHEVFPAGVDPFTRQSPTQGWQFNLQGDSSGDQIQWIGFFQGVLTLLTQKAVYRVFATSQIDFSAASIVKVLDVGCQNGDTVREVNGALYWVSDGPRVLRWNGSHAEGPQDISYRRISNVLLNAPSLYWSNWFANVRNDQHGAYYHLLITPQGYSSNTLRLDFSVVLDAWEPVAYYDNSGQPLPWEMGNVWTGAPDAQQYFQAHPWNGQLWQVETGVTDNGVVVPVKWKTKKLGLGGMVCKLERIFTRFAAATDDSLTMTVRTAGSEYKVPAGASAYTDNTQGADLERGYTIALDGDEDVEVMNRVHFDMKGRWLQLYCYGNVDEGMEVREVEARATPIREGKLGA